MNCDPIARVYRWLEFASFGRALQRRREAFLNEIAGAQRVLMLGDGDGRFLAAFLCRNPQAKVDSVDSSARMLAMARARVERRVGRAVTDGRVRFFQADAAQWRPPAGAGYDLIVTHFFLDCFTDRELTKILPPLAQAAAPDVRWLVSEFRQPAKGPTAWRAQVWLWALYAAFRLMTGLKAGRLPGYAAHLEELGFTLSHAAIANGGLLTSELWSRG